jgi:hypothetical protein
MDLMAMQTTRFIFNLGNPPAAREVPKQTPVYF